MSDDLGPELRAMLAGRDPGAPSAAFRARAQAIGRQSAAPARRFGWRGLQAAAALTVAVALVAAVALPRLTFGPGPTGPGKTGVPATTATPPSSPLSARPLNAFERLVAGQSAPLDCGPDSPDVSPSGRFIYCDSAIRTWPGLEVVADTGRQGFGWGVVDGREGLLVVSQKDGTAALVDTTGKRTPIEGVSSAANLFPSWSWDDTTLTLQGGNRFGSATLERWSGSGWSMLGTIRVAADEPVGEVGASADGTWLVSSSAGCASPGGCTSTIAVARASDTALARIAGNRIAGTAQFVAVGNDGSIVAIVGAGTATKVYRAAPGNMLAPVADGGPGWWFGGDRVVVSPAASSAAKVTEIDLTTLRVTSVTVAPAMSGEILGVGAGGIAARVNGKLRIQASDGSIVDMPTTVGPNATVRLYAGWAFVFDGPPPTTVAVRR